MSAAIRNPYAGRGPFAGRQQELAEIREYLAQGDSALLIGGRRAGKTSLAEHLGDIERPLYRFDAPSCSLESEANVIRALGRKLGGDCGTRDELTALLRSRAPLAVVVDEADQILAETWAGSFLSYLRHLVDNELRSELAILLIGGPALNRYKNPDDKGSPPLNTARRVYLQPLKREARRELAAPLPAPPDFDWLDLHAAGHPWLLQRLLEQLWRGRSQDEALERVFAEALPNFEIWKRQLGEAGHRFLDALPPDGVARTALLRDPAWRPYHEAAVIAKSLCLVDVDEQGRVRRGPALFLDWLGTAQVADEWDLAISYASEDVTIAREIAKELTGKMSVFFAPDQNAYLWGDDLNRVLPQTYGVNARYVLALTSKAYVKKHWTNVEWQAALGGSARKLLVMELDALPPDMPPGLIYRAFKPENLISLISDLTKVVGRA
ncbi:MAG TPA: TIR domain-containing protein [Thermoanaerobaculia bacterium]|nr:TIR domain-containing protein [Thermoanaerobaculia bacterium]